MRSFEDEGALGYALTVCVTTNPKGRYFKFLIFLLL